MKRLVALPDAAPVEAEIIAMLRDQKSRSAGMTSFEKRAREATTSSGHAADVEHAHEVLDADLPYLVLQLPSHG